jgi:glycine/D-amino acid oxidase-like deaminating enzyme
MNVDVIIIGQGICGTMLSWYLERAGISFVVIDESKPFTASKAAAGIINPVTGRRIVKTWMIDELMPFAWKEYQSLQNELNTELIAEKKIIDFFPSPQMRQAFLKRFEEDQQYLGKPDDEKEWNHYFNYEFGWGEIHPVYLVDVQRLLFLYRKKLSEQQQLIEDRFIPDQLIISENKIHYKDIFADKIIFCDGMGSADNNFFKGLPFAPNKGEALIIEADLPPENIYKKGINIVPWKENLFWVGSSYQWEFKDDQPTELFLQKTEALLKQWLKSIFKIMDHFASVRPATLERRPFLGFHPQYQSIGIMNGMGTKGCSLAPYFARELTQHLLTNSPIMPEADIRRFARILAKTNPGTGGR